MVTVTFDENGNITGYYPDGLGYASIPVPNVQTDEQTHRDAYANPGKYRVVDGHLVAADPWPPAPTEAEVRAQANAPVLEQIAALEAQQTPRLLREALVEATTPAVDPRTGRTAREQLAWIDEQIATLRSQLQ
jgi:hypothetical protein